MVDRESVETYKPSGKCAPKGIAAMAGLGLGGTVAACLLVYLVWGVVSYYLGIVFAVLLGVGVGAAVLFGVRLGKCRLPMAAGALGLALAVSGYVGLHYLNYCSIIRKFRKSVDRQLGEASRDRKLVAVLVKEQIITQWGGTGFGAYVREWRREGWKASWLRVLVQTLWGLEVIVAGGLGAAIPFLASHDAFCEACDRWCDHKQVLVAPLAARDEILDASNPEDVARLAAIEPAAKHVSRCVVDIDFCPVCKRTGFISVRTFEEKGAEGTKEEVAFSDVVVSGEHVGALLEGGGSGKPTGAGGEPDKEAPAEAAPPPDEQEEDPGEGPPGAEDVGGRVAREGVVQDAKKDGLKDGEV